MQNKNILKNKTIFITGASRGIGRSMALKFAKDNANIIIASKTTIPHHTLPGTIFTVAQEIEDNGGKALPIQLDVQNVNNIKQAIKKTINIFGGIDILINNAGAINLKNINDISTKEHDLINNINYKATFFTIQSCLQYLKQSKHAHILNISPPINLNAHWLNNHLSYTISKYNMTLCTLGLTHYLKKYNIAINSLWPKTIIATSAISWMMGKQIFNHCRKPDIMSDAAYMILHHKPTHLTGNTFIDEDVLRTNNINNFDKYAYNKQKKIYKDLFID